MRCCWKPPPALRDEECFRVKLCSVDCLFDVTGTLPERAKLPPAFSGMLFLEFRIGVVNCCRLLFFLPPVDGPAIPPVLFLGRVSDLDPPLECFELSCELFSNIYAEVVYGLLSLEITLDRYWLKIFYYFGALMPKLRSECSMFASPKRPVDAGRSPAGLLLDYLDWFE